MKKAIGLLLSLTLVLTLIGCNAGTTQSSGNAALSNVNGSIAEAPADTVSAKNSSENAETQSSAAQSTDETTQANADDLIEDEAWESLESLGRIETENGMFYVSITFPAELVGEDITQESIDAEAGSTYTSGKLNPDGSVTYKMTKAQHKEMLNSVTTAIEEGLQELVDSPDYAFTKITHNKDFTVFDVNLSTDTVGLTEGFMALGFYMYGGMYGLLSGHETENIAVNYYSAAGDLLNTANSSDMQ